MQQRVFRREDRPLDGLQRIVTFATEADEASQTERAARAALDRLVSNSVSDLATLVVPGAQPRMLIENLARAGEIEARIAHPLRNVADDPPVGTCFSGRWKERTLARNPALGVGDGAVLFSPAERRQQMAIDNAVDLVCTRGGLVHTL